MRAVTVVAACGEMGVATALACAQPSIGYRLQPTSMLTEVFCPPPCLCPYHEESGAMTGTFTLSRALIDPQYVHYVVTGVDFTASVNGADVRLTGSGTYRIGGLPPVPHQELILDLIVDGVAEHFDSGLVLIDTQQPFPTISIQAQTQIVACFQYVIQVLALPDPTVCYANCDGSTAPPILNANDFQCFLNKFAAGDPYANCDGSTSSPALNANDFQCFLNAFTVGCS
jgi:hypothetical protein